MKLKTALPLMLLLACNVADDQSFRSRDPSYIEPAFTLTDPNWHPSPCRIAPDSQACLFQALMTPLWGEYGRYSVQDCTDDPSSATCHEHVRYLCSSQGLIDDCQQLHSAATRCVDLGDWNCDGMVDPSDRAVTDALCADPNCLADGTCPIEPYPLE